MLAANIWHWWIGVLMFAAAIGAVGSLILGYLKSVSSQQYPNKRQREQ